MIVEPITHIQRDEHGVAWIEGSNTKVIEVAMDQAAYGWEAEDIRAAHPHLSLAQIYAALSHYHDHKHEMDKLMDGQMEEYRRARVETSDQISRRQLLERLSST